MNGTVYLLHFGKPYKHAQHYIGWTGIGVGDRVQRHLDGKGSPLIKAHIANGGDLRLARIWEGANRKFERKLKNQKKTSEFCPECSGLKAYNRQRLEAR